MNDMTSNNAVHWSFWVVGVIGLLWNAGGCANYLMQTNLEFVANMPETHRAIIEGRPVWATGGFAIGVFGGVLASVMLLFKKAIALYVYVISLLGILLTMVHTIIVGIGKTSFNLSEMFVMIVLPVLVAIFLAWYARYCVKKSWVV